MLPYKHFTLNERKCLQEFLNQGYSMRKIAEFLGRNVSSVSREINRNKSQYPTKKKIIINIDTMHGELRLSP